MSQFMRLHEAAVAVFGSDSGITGRTLNVACRSGKLTHYRVAGKLFTTIEDVTAWARSARVPCGAAVSPSSPYREPNAPVTDAVARAAVERATAAIKALEVEAGR
jgi:hypothetical protein